MENNHFDEVNIRNSFSKSMGNRARHTHQNGGYTLIEIMITLAILAVISSISIVSYNQYIETTRNAAAASQIRALAFIINSYGDDNGGVYPQSLNDIGNQNLLDPWGNPYQYLNINTANGLGSVRKDRNLVPLNTNFDLYSNGADGQSRSPLTAPVSDDDIIYANDGGYIGLGKDY